MPGKTEKDSGEQGILRSDQMNSKEKDTDGILWEEDEAIFTKDVEGSFCSSMAEFHEAVRLRTKTSLRPLSDLSDEEFEKAWESLKEAGQVFSVFVKRNADGDIVNAFSPAMPSAKWEVE